jgi:hypothetical protein
MWVKRKKARASLDTRKAPAVGPARCPLGDGAFLTISAAMGKLFDVPARPQALDLGEDASGWQRLREFRRRRGGD